MINKINYYSWIKENLIKNNLDKNTLYDLYDQFKQETNSEQSLDTYKRKVRAAFSELKENLVQNGDLDEEAFLILEAKKQKLLDVNNILRKTNRESYRLYNVLESIYEEYIDVLKQSNFVDFEIKKHEIKKNGKTGILQLSDIHAGELINEFESNGNKYDFVILSKRLKKYISEAIALFNFYNIENVYIFGLGDMLNSTRRLSERLSQATSQVRSSLLLTYILQQAIIELSQYFNISIAFVVGNESRIGDVDMESQDIMSSENWDYLIFQNLRLLFEDKGIKFHKSDSNIQTVVNINGFNALLIHGHTLKSQYIEKQVALLMQNYIYKGIPIHGVFMGHFHHANIGDLISMGSSLCGSNSYSAQDLMFVSRASQNIYIINEDKGYHGIKIDLQNVEGIEGYIIIEELERYNVRNTIYNNKVTIENLV